MINKINNRVSQERAGKRIELAIRQAVTSLYIPETNQGQVDIRIEFMNTRSGSFRLPGYRFIVSISSGCPSNDLVNIVPGHYMFSQRECLKRSPDSFLKSEFSRDTMNVNKPTSKFQSGLAFHVSVSFIYI
jgi:hypothetical protein